MAIFEGAISEKTKKLDKLRSREADPPAYTPRMQFPRTASCSCSEESKADMKKKMAWGWMVDWRSHDEDCIIYRRYIVKTVWESGNPFIHPDDRFMDQDEDEPNPYPNPYNFNGN